MRPAFAVLRGGRSGATVSISDTTVEDLQPSPSSATASLTLESDGDTTASTGDIIGDWLIGSTAGSNYEARATIVSGTLSSGTTGSWLALSSNRTWSVTRSSLGSKTCTFDLEIGLAGANNALDTARITLTAEVEP